MVVKKYAVINFTTHVHVNWSPMIYVLQIITLKKYCMLQQKFSGHLDGMAPSICQTLAYMTTLALVPNVQYTSPMGFQA
jgi:hypothetical protein